MSTVLEYWHVDVDRKSTPISQTEKAKWEPVKESLYYRIDHIDGSIIMINHDDIGEISWWPVFEGESK